MSGGTQGPQSKSCPPRRLNHVPPADQEVFPPDFPPITNEDLLKLDVEPQLIPFVVSTAQRAEQSSSGEPQLTSTEAENLVEILDRVRLPANSPPRAKSQAIRSCHPTP